MNETKLPENRAYKVTLILLLGLAAFSTAMKELNRLHDMVSSVHELTRQWAAPDQVTINEKSSSTVEAISPIELCPNGSRPLIGSASELVSSDAIAAASDSEIDDLYYETIAEPQLGARVDLITGQLAVQKSNRKVPRLARSRYAPARNLKEEIAVNVKGSNWPVRFEYKARDGRMTVQLPLSMLTNIKADTLDTEESQDFVLSLLGRPDRKQPHARTDIRRRELIKRFERNISSRRAS